MILFAIMSMGYKLISAKVYEAAFALGDLMKADEFIWARKTRSNVRRHAGDHPDTHLLVTDQSVEPRTSVLCVLLSSGHPPSLSAITRMSSDEVQMKMSYMCPTSVLLLSDYLPVAPITLLLVTYQHHLCVTNWNVSDQYPTKLVGNEKIRFPTSFRPAIGLCGRGHNPEEYGSIHQMKHKEPIYDVHSDCEITLKYG